MNAVETQEKPVPAIQEFLQELAAYWAQLPNKLFFFILLAAWLVLFQLFGNSTFGFIDTPSLFDWTWRVYMHRDMDGNLGDDSFGGWVPFVVLGLIWWKRKELAESRLAAWWPGLVLLAMSMVLHIIGYLIQQPRVSIMALLAGVYALTGLAWGPGWLRKTFFPFFLLVFCIPFSSILEPVTFPLRLLASRIVEVICHNVLAIDVVRQGTLLSDPGNRYQYEVAGPCSGIRSLVSIGFVSTVVAFVFLKPWWQRLLLMILSAPLAVLGNVLRLVTIIVTAEMGGQEAGNYVHSGGPFGLLSLLPYIPAFLGLLGAVAWLNRRRKAGAA